MYSWTDYSLMPKQRNTSSDSSLKLLNCNLQIFCLFLSPFRLHGIRFQLEHTNTFKTIVTTPNGIIYAIQFSFYKWRILILVTGTTIHKQVREMCDGRRAATISCWEKEDEEESNDIVQRQRNTFWYVKLNLVWNYFGPSEPDSGQDIMPMVHLLYFSWLSKNCFTFLYCNLFCSYSQLMRMHCLLIAFWLPLAFLVSPTVTVSYSYHVSTQNCSKAHCFFILASSEASRTVH